MSFSLSILGFTDFPSLLIRLMQLRQSPSQIINMSCDYWGFFLCASLKLFSIVPRIKIIEKLIVIVKLFCLLWAVSGLMSWVNSVLTFTLLLFSFPFILSNLLANYLSTFCKGVTASWSFVVLKSIHAVNNLFGLARFSCCHPESF